MDKAGSVTKEEKNYLRELAKKYKEYSELPVMREREKLWCRHNRGQGERPMLIVEYNTFLDDLLPPPKCVSPAAVEIEKRLLAPMRNHELIDDDKVFPSAFPVPIRINFEEFGMNLRRHTARDASGKELGYAMEHPITNLSEGLGRLNRSVYSDDSERTSGEKKIAEDVFGDILPVELKNTSLEWFVTPSEKAIRLMGMESLYLNIIDEPDLIHRLFRFLTDDIIRYVRWQSDNGLLTLNNGNDYIGASSYGFTDELPSAGFLKNGKVTPKDLWVNMNSQETLGISPAMYEEFIFPYYRELAEVFGLVYYGCCEPVHAIWMPCLRHLPNLRKVSVSPWCDENAMGEYLKGGSVIYSRKPSSIFLGINQLVESDLEADIKKTLDAARGCRLEIIFRDVYTLNGDLEKPGRAVKLVRKLIEREA